MEVVISGLQLMVAVFLMLGGIATVIWKLGRGDAAQRSELKSAIDKIQQEMEEGFNSIHRELAGFGGAGGLVQKVDRLEQQATRLDSKLADSRLAIRNELAPLYGGLDNRVSSLENRQHEDIRTVNERLRALEAGDARS